ncbi:zinc transporter ZntB [Arenicella chitinivorans]|uniref:Zinc transporter ZntB n=1 Tax=Arenicella chitinivorans TaxID=1329800 RepID=A0A918RHJ4_9GAMM|nr:zinc transporter ZntB [Arenicella chitinivorans]GGZ98109.1 zinc transporter ZntB [Arenicella chitinivorans]
MNSPSEPLFLFQYLLSPTANIQLTTDHQASLPDDPEACLWQHLDLSKPESYPWLSEAAGVDPVIVEALAAQETRPRAFAHKQGVLVVLRGVNTNPGHNPEDMVSVRIWIEKNRIISSRNRRLLSVCDLANSLDQEDGPHTSGEFLTDLIERVADRIGDYVNRLEDELAEAEDSLEDNDADDLRSRLGSLRRQIASVRRFLAPQRDALDRMHYVENNIFTDHDRQRLREESDRISRYLEDLDLARERAIVLQEAFLSQLAQQQNTRMYVLSVVAAIFLPLGFLTGLLGMNVGGLPGVESPYGFVFASLLMVIATLGLISFFKWKKWI